jgi:alpha-amylase
MKRTARLFVVLMLLLLLTACQSTPADDLTRTSAQDYGYPWWNDTVFYQILVRSFYDSDGDGIGDFNGIIEKLDYLNDGDPKTDSDLGITGLWLMPITPSPSYHGYDVTDYKDVNPEYGTMEDFERLIEECHKRGIVVIIDWEINHSSTRHPWFIAAQDPESEYHDWYVWSEERPNYKGPWGQDVWHLSPTNGLYYYGIFWDGMPDLNYGNPDVNDAMLDAVDFWIAEKNVDGIRIDAAAHLIEDGQNQKHTEATHAWFQDFHQWFRATDADALAIGEVWDSSIYASRYVTDQGLDMVFNFDLAGKFMQAASTRYGYTALSGLETELTYFPDFQMGTFLANHDMARAMTNFREEVGKAKSAASMLLTSPGVPFIYYGEEIGMSGGKPDENIRSPMQWDDSKYAGFTSAAFPWRLPQNDYTEKNVQMQEQDPESLLNHYRTLIQLREAYPALKVGDFYALQASDPRLFVALRTTEEETMLVLINVTDQEISDYTLSLAEGPLSGAYTAFDLFNGDELAAVDLTADDNGGFSGYTPFESLPAYSTYILWLAP